MVKLTQRRLVRIYMLSRLRFRDSLCVVQTLRSVPAARLTQPRLVCMAVNYTIQDSLYCRADIEERTGGEAYITPPGKCCQIQGFLRTHLALRRHREARWWRSIDVPAGFVPSLHATTFTY